MPIIAAIICIFIVYEKGPGLPAAGMIVYSFQSRCAVHNSLQ